MVSRRLAARAAALIAVSLLFFIRGEAFKPAWAHSVTTITIDHFAYQPATVTVDLGNIVEWRNVDIVPHTATSTDGKTFNSGAIANGASWRFTANRKGTFDYFCTLHPNMKARLIVQ
ncbi:MAG TPA: cupredoxin family copper-binding protein [Bryobacteraceae bacterium]|nr:cupredoxin family copper-binding protein [Bryobacteraceae bacterium]